MVEAVDGRAPARAILTPAGRAVRPAPGIRQVRRRVRLPEPALLVTTTPYHWLTVGMKENDSAAPAAWPTDDAAADTRPRMKVPGVDASLDIRNGFSSIDFFEDRKVPYVVAVNLFDGAPRYDPEDIRDALTLGPHVELVLCDARERESVRDVLVTLVEYAIREHRRAPVRTGWPR